MCVFGFFIGGLNFIGLGMIENGADTPDNLVWTWVLELYRLEWDLNRVVIEGSDRAKVEYYGSSMSEDFTFDDEATSIFEEKRTTAAPAGLYPDMVRTVVRLVEVMTTQSNQRVKSSGHQKDITLLHFNNPSRF
jgi:hypothetical protein